MTGRPSIEAAVPGRWRYAPGLFSGLLVAVAVTVVGVGIADAWIRDRDWDMRKRETEYGLFRDGVYPDPAVEAPPVGRTRVHSVYPPWALPLFSLFFEPGGKLQGRICIEVLSLAALSVMGWYGWQRLRPFGLAPGIVGAVAGAAIAGNASAFSIGQFSILCMGAVAAEMLFLERERPVAAGVCWALAMLKPQIGIAFAPLLLVRGRRIGFMAGVLVLAALSLLACWWTGVSPSSIVARWLVRNRLEFNGHAPLQLAIQSWTGMSQRVLVIVGMSLLAAAAGYMLLRAAPAADSDPLRLAAPLAAIGMLAVYHRHYDNVMLWPTLIAALEWALRTGRRTDVIVAAVLGTTLLIHDHFLSAVPYGRLAAGAVWAAAACHLLGRAVLSAPPGRGKEATPA